MTQPQWFPPKWIDVAFICLNRNSNLLQRRRIVRDIVAYARGMRAREARWKWMSPGRRFSGVILTGDDIKAGVEYMFFGIAVVFMIAYLNAIDAPGSSRISWAVGLHGKRSVIGCTLSAAAGSLVARFDLS